MYNVFPKHLKKLQILGKYLYINIKNRKNEQKNLESLEEKCIDLETNYETMCEILELE